MESNENRTSTSKKNQTTNKKASGAMTHENTTNLSKARRALGKSRNRRRAAQHKTLAIEALQERALMTGLFTVGVDPGDYAGSYDAGEGSVQGQSTIELAPGNYSLQLGSVAESIDFTLDDNGIVTVDDEDDHSAVGGQQTLSLRNVVVDLNAGDFEGTYSVRGVTNEVSGTQSVVLIPGVDNYEFRIKNTSTIFTFDVNGNGDVNSDREVSAVGGDRSLTLQNVDVTFSPGDYLGEYRIRSVTTKATGARKVVLVPGVDDYRMDITNTSGLIRFDVDAQGNVTSDHTESVSTSGNVLRFNNVLVEFDPQDYTGEYRLRSVTGRMTGPQSVVLVPGINNYRMDLTNTSGLIRFDVDGGGNVSSDQVESVYGSENTLTFLNTQVGINPTTYEGNYQIRSVAHKLTGHSCVSLVPGISGYSVDAHGPPTTSFTLDLNDDGSPVQESVTIGSEGTSHKMLFGECASPNVDAGGSYRVEEGSSRVLSGSANSELEDSGVTLTYEWDLDGDGVYGETGNDATRGDEVGATPTFSAAEVDGPNSTTVGLRVTDSMGNSSTDFATVDVLNADPVIAQVETDATMENKGLPNQAVTINGLFRDAGVSDTHEITIDWGDGSPLETVSPDSFGDWNSLKAEHNYSQGGVYEVTVTVQDDDFGTAVASTTAIVTGVRLHDGVLQIVGTSGDDAVDVGLWEDGVWVKTRFNSAPDEDTQLFQFDATDVTSIQAILCDGDDSIQVGPSWSPTEFLPSDELDVPTDIDAGPGDDTIISSLGDDTLNGGSGDDIIWAGGGDDVVFGEDGADVLLGEEGADSLYGGDANDVIIGGIGSDELRGENGEDLLIGGTSSYDADGETLLAIRKAWTADADYRMRVADLQTESAKAPHLAAGSTVLDDDDADELWGGDNQDWMFAGLADAIMDGQAEISPRPAKFALD